MKKELVSIITPMYNGGEFVQETINSVQKQTYQNWELIIIDDCSPDQGLGERVVKKSADGDTRILFTRLPRNKGSSGARNEAIKRASGEYLALLDADDLWDPEFLEKQLRFITDKDATIAYSSYRRVAEDGKSESLPPFIVPLESTYKSILKSLPIFPSTAIINIGKIGKYYFNETMGSLRDDYVFWLQLLKGPVKKAYGNQEILVSYRMRQASVTANKLKVIKPHWVVLRQIEKLSLLSCAYYFCCWAFISIKKYKKLR